MTMYICGFYHYTVREMEGEKQKILTKNQQRDRLRDDMFADFTKERVKKKK